MTGVYDLPWRVHTPNLTEEVLRNPTASILMQPMNIFRRILCEVAERASELNDDKMNALMMRLTLYEVSDPSSPQYDRQLVEETLTRNGYGLELLPLPKQKGNKNGKP